MIIQQNDPQASSRTLIHFVPTTERTQQRALRTPVGTESRLRVRALLARGDVREGDVNVYDDLVSFYSLGAMTGHGAPPARATSTAGTVS